MRFLSVALPPRVDLLQARLAAASEPIDALDEELSYFELAGDCTASSATPPATEEAETEREKQIQSLKALLEAVPRYSVVQLIAPRERRVALQVGVIRRCSAVVSSSGR